MSSRPLKKFLQTPAGLATIAGVCAVALIAIIFAAYARIANPAMPVGNPVTVREIYLVIDPTASMDPQILQEAKDKILHQVFPALGPGDRVFCYSIGPTFVEAGNGNRVFGMEALPQVGENLLDPYKARKIDGGTIADLWRQTREVTERQWTPQLQGLAPPPNPGSQYLEALDYVAERLRSAGAPQLRERRLIVIGDLYQQPTPDPLVAPDPENGEEEAFGRTQVRLIYPYKSHRRSETELSSKDLEKFWREYFRKRGNDQIDVTTFDDATPLLPPSPVPGAPR